MKGQDINQLYASGNNAQVTALMTKIMGRLTNVEVALLKHSPEVSNLELSFLSSGGFPKEIFRQITSSIQFSYGLYIRVMTDQIGKDYNEEHIFQHDIWNFEIRPSLKRHNSKGTYYTTGAYIEPISYSNSLGKTVYGWIVTGFEADTFCDGDSVDVSDYATFLDGLTPPADDEDRKTEYIIHSLQSFDFQRIELGLYKTMLEDGPSSVYIRQLDDISHAGHITQIESTLDKYLLDCPHFSQTLREILVDTFGRDRQDIFLADENALIIGSCRANIWKIQEHPHKYIPSEQENVLPPKQRIQQMLLNYGTINLEFDEKLGTASGYITGVATEGFDYSHGVVGYYEDLDDDVLEDLAAVVEMQIEANQKQFDKSQGI
ncbi:MAG: hypothetical protein LBQ74_20145 [Prevotella sp.]|jgi:hypothetical protein|nr:hypothetical protein [Prevotella sp.]